MDAESETWIRDLTSDGVERQQAVSRLHQLLLRVACAEGARRRERLPARVQEELEDLATQAASDATLAVTRKLGSFRGAARFTTWACKFVILEFSTKVRRRIWRSRAVEADESIWNRLPTQGPNALQEVESRELVAALRRAVQDRLTEHQRMIFQSAALDDVPIDVLAERLASSRGAIYKTLHDARRKLRTALMAEGYLEGIAS